MKSVIRAVVVAVVVVAEVSGCGPLKDKDPAPVMSAIPTAAAEGSLLICGMDRAALKAAAGVTVGRTEGELRMVDGIGSGECSVWAKDESLVTGSLVNVRMYSVVSPDGVKDRSRLLGTGGLPAPDLTYPTVDGGIWGDIKAKPGRMTSEAVSDVFYGNTVIEVLLSRGDVDRDRPADQLALTQQVAATYGLVAPGGAVATPAS